MKKLIIYISIVLLLILSCIIFPFLFRHKQENLANVYDSLVYIESISDDSIKSGSGFVYKVDNNKNYVITCYHVIEDYENIFIYNTDRKKIKASVLNYDQYTDVAILLIEDNLNLKEISIGNSDEVRVSDDVYVAGTPLNIDYISTLSKGIVSFVNREITIKGANGSNVFKTIQVDAETHSGNSGGPLLNKEGKVIGMMFVKEENADGISFSLPINYVMDIVKKMDSNGA